MIKIIYLILWTLPTILRYIRNDLFCLLYSKRIARLSKDNPLHIFEQSKGGALKNLMKDIL